MRLFSRRCSKSVRTVLAWAVGLESNTMMSFCRHWNYRSYWDYCTTPSSICPRYVCSYRARYTVTRLGPDELIYRALSQHDLSHQLVIERINIWSFPGGVDCPTEVDRHLFQTLHHLGSPR